MLDYLSSTSTNRTINSLTTDDTGTEVSVTYNYKDETSPSGRPLIIKNTLQAPTRYASHINNASTKTSGDCGISIGSV